MESTFSMRFFHTLILLYRVMSFQSIFDVLYCTVCFRVYSSRRFVNDVVHDLKRWRYPMTIKNGENSRDHFEQEWLTFFQPFPPFQTINILLLIIQVVQVAQSRLESTITALTSLSKHSSSSSFSTLRTNDGRLNNLD